MVITLSSDSESESEVEIVGSYSNKNEILPLSSVRVEVDALNIVSEDCIDVTAITLAPEKLGLLSRLHCATSPVLDLTEDNIFLEDTNLPTDDCQIVDIIDSQENCTKANFKDKPPEKNEEPKICVGRTALKSEKNVCGKKSYFHQSASVELKRLSFLENHLKELLTLDRAYVIKIGETMSLHLKQEHKDAEGCPESSYTTTLEGLKPFITAQQDTPYQGKASGSHKELSLTHCSQANNGHLERQISHPTFAQDSDGLSTIPSPRYASSLDKEQSLFSKDLRSFSPSLPVGTSTVQPHLNVFRNSSPTHFTTFHCEDVKSLHQTIPEKKILKNTGILHPQCDDILNDKASRSSCQTLEPSSSLSGTINLDEEPFTYEDDFDINSPMSFSLGQSGEDEDENESFELGCTSAIQDDKYYVCPVGIKNLPQRGDNVLIDEEDGSSEPQMMCRQSLSLVYSTIDEGYQEGTLQLLSDLLQPGYYPPKDITSHLLWGIMLNPHSPHHICVHAFELLMRAQRYHIADKWSAPWDWEMLTNVMENQEHRPEIVRMFLEYVVQTIEDDFRTKQTTSTLVQSLAKAILSFDQQFSHIRDICKWLFFAIVKSVDYEVEGEYIRIVAIFQRLLSLALEVDCSPAICSAKLSQELFHMLISSVTLRTQRMVLLESLQSKLLRCKLLEHLLDYSCPVKTSVPMSISLLLHFLKNCDLLPDPKDGTEKWRKWEELLCLLWMLLLSYNHAMNGYLHGSKVEQRDRFCQLVYKPEDIVSKCAVHEAVEAFLSRSHDDIGEALPLHVEESLTYLQDHLLDVCQT